MMNLTDHVAAYLLNHTPLFDSGKYTLYAGIDLRGIVRGGARVTDQELYTCLDLLVCRQNMVAAGIVCDPKTERLFTTYLPMLPYVKLCFDELPFSPALDDVGFPLPSEENLKTMYAQLLGELRGHNGSATYRMDPLGQSCYTLPTISINLAAAYFQQTTAELLEKLKREGLLDSRRMPTAYGKACGLLLQCSSNFTGKVSSDLMTTVNGLKVLESALNWKPVYKREQTLSDRVARLTAPNPVGDAYAVPALKKLLSTPLHTLFRDWPNALEKLMNTLKRSDSYLSPKHFPAVSTMQSVTYHDCLERICALRQQFGPDPWLDSFRQANIRNTCEMLLLQLSEAFIPPPEADPGPTAPVEKQCLSERIRHHQPKRSTNFTIIRTPLIHYYYAAACLAGNDYPNWLYRSAIRPLLSEDTHPETAFDLAALFRYCHDLHDNPDVNDRDETFPLLYKLLVEPIVQSTENFESEVSA